MRHFFGRPGISSGGKSGLPGRAAGVLFQFFSWSGHAGRREYVKSWLVYMAVVPFLVFAGYWASMDDDFFVLTAMDALLLAALSSLMLLPCLGLVCRRLHDSGLSGFWTFPVYMASLAAGDQWVHYLYRWAESFHGSFTAPFFCYVMLDGMFFSFALVMILLVFLPVRRDPDACGKSAATSE